MIARLLVCSVLLTGPALAQTPAAVPEAVFANTVVSTYPDGRTAKLWLERDGGYRGMGRRGKPSSGRWMLKGDQICLKQVRPFRAPFAYCTPLRQGEVGTEWAGKAVTGEPVTIKLVAGR
jgi:hypothetical protein